jgi:hypothetical protein
MIKKRWDKFKQHRPLEDKSKWAIIISASDRKTNIIWDEETMKP